MKNRTSFSQILLATLFFGIFVAIGVFSYTNYYYSNLHRCSPLSSSGICYICNNWDLALNILFALLVISAFLISFIKIKTKYNLMKLRTPIVVIAFVLLIFIVWCEHLNIG